MALFNKIFGRKDNKTKISNVNIRKGTYDIICPFCFKKFKSNNVVFRAEHSEEGDPEYEKTVDEELNNYNQKIGKSSVPELNPIIKPESLPKGNIKVVDGVILEIKDKYDVTTDKRLCPYCHNELPITSGRGPTSIVSVVGASQVGKSVYMTCLLYVLEHYVSERFNGALIAGNSEYNEEIKENQQIVFEYNKMLEPTPKEHIDPLIANFRFKDDTKPPITFAFYDVPGEGMTDKSYIDKHGEHIKNSSGIIFLVDPLQMKTLRKKLNILNKEEQGDFTAKYQEPKDILVYFYENFIGKESGAATDIPTAVVVTKTDMLKNLNDPEYLSPNSNIFKNYKHSIYFDLDEFENINGEMKRFLGKADSPFKGAMEAYFRNTSYFGVSALGSNPQNLEININNTINPLRVEEPFLWLMYKMKYIPGGSEK